MTTAIGVYGAGDSNRRNTTALVKDFVSQFETFSLVLPATVPTFSAAVRHVADLAVDQQYNLAFVADKHDLADLEDYPDVPVSEVAVTVEDALAEVDHLLVAWNDEIDDDWIEALIRKGVRVYDLTDGLFEITVTDEEEVTTPAPKHQVEEPDPVDEPEQGETDKEPADEAQALASTSRVMSWPPKSGDEINTPAFYESLIQEVERRVLERLRAAL